MGSLDKPWSILECLVSSCLKPLSLIYGISLELDNSKNGSLDEGKLEMSTISRQRTSLSGRAPSVVGLGLFLTVLSLRERDSEIISAIRLDVTWRA